MLTAVSGRYNNTFTMVYDEAGRLSSESQTISGQTYTVGRSYNDRSQVASYTYPDGSLVERAYTDRGQLEEVRYAGSVIDTRVYDAGGRLDTSTYGNGFVIDVDYRDDANGKDNLLESIVTTHPGSLATNRLVGDFSYTYDDNKNKTSEVITGTMSNYGFNSSASPAVYDDDDRLTTWNRTDGNKDQSWNLSLVGDWNTFTEEAVLQTRTHNGAHETTMVGAMPVAHDVKGNITTNQNLHIYSWDFDNRLTGVNTDSMPGDEASFEYDALGRRVRANQSNNMVLVYAGQQLVAEYFSGGAVSNARRK